VTGLDLHREWHVDDIEARIELAPVADDDHTVAEISFGERIAEFRPDAGRLTGSYDEWFAVGHT
jgi:hypothetical protein